MTQEAIEKFRELDFQRKAWNDFMKSLDDNYLVIVNVNPKYRALAEFHRVFALDGETMDGVDELMNTIRQFALDKVKYYEHEMEML